MKKVVILAIVLFGSFSIYSQNIDGVWEETSTTEHKNSTVVICQLGDNVYLTCYWEFRGAPIVWKGEGKREGNRIAFDYEHSKLVTGWDPKGKQVLTISGDGKKMTGTWSNTRNESGPLTYIRKSEK